MAKAINRCRYPRSTRCCGTCSRIAGGIGNSCSQTRLQGVVFDDSKRIAAVGVGGYDEILASLIKRVPVDVAECDGRFGGVYDGDRCAIIRRAGCLPDRLFQSDCVERSRRRLVIVFGGDPGGRAGGVGGAHLIYTTGEISNGSMLGIRNSYTQWCCSIG